MKTCKSFTAIAAALLTTTSLLSAQTIAKWTFETSVPATAGPHAAEVGSGSALGFHAGATVYSNPAGNGSAESFSSTLWAIGDYYQFSLSTVGYSGIGVSFDQTSSSTGPRDFDLTYSTDGFSFSALASYDVLLNGAPNLSWSSTTNQVAYSFSYDLSSVTALDNASTVIFRLVNTSAVAINGGGVATGGTSRVDNFSVSVVPEPTVVSLIGGLGLALFIGRQRNR
jgi:hypothetical protein